jgi:hypothetical protein
MRTFKITPPEGILKDHLSGRSGSARNFELLRLATTGLLLETGGLKADSFSVNENKNPNHLKEEIMPKEVISSEPTEVIKAKVNIVDFGEDIINL